MQILHSLSGRCWMKKSGLEVEPKSDHQILIIDDDEGMSYTIARMVEEAGYVADTAFLLETGLKKALTGDYDVVFLDVRLPDGNGLEIIPKIRSIAFAPEIIIITAYGEQGGADLALKSGAWDYLQKPAEIRTMELSSDLTLILPFPLIQQLRCGLLTICLLNGFPKLQKIVEVPLQLFAAAADASGANDHAHPLRNFQLTHRFAQVVPVFALDAS